jgi:N-acetylglucosamine-6-phosphate deacetylase
VILHGRVLTGGEQLPPSRVELAGSRIVAVEPGGSAAGADLIVEDGWIAPGLIDLQVNGAAGVDLASAEEPAAAVSTVARALVRHGVTAFCPTLVTAPPERIMASLPAFAPRAIAGGASSLGAHVEGPFISERFRGVHDPRFLRAPDVDEARRWLFTPPAIVTLAPELDGALELVRLLSAAGVVVSIGHTGASAAEVRAALEAGARMGTHLFNAMAPLHHRAPGPIGALMASASTIGLIVDGVHVDPVAVELVVRAAGPGRVALVSDAIAAAGMPPGRYRLGEQEIESDGVTARRADGTIGGSATMLERCLRNARAWLPWLAPAEVVRMATETPARALGLRKGSVAIGYDADLVVLDREWGVAATIVAGAQVMPSMSS